MNKLLILLFLGTAITVNAQIEKGVKTIGGLGQGYIVDLNGNYKRFSLTLQPNAGLFIKKNLLLQGNSILGIGFNESINGKSFSTSLGLGASLRKYVTVSERFMPWAEFGLTGYYFYSNYKPSVGGRIREHNVIPASWIALGTSYFITPNLSIDASLNYNIDLTNLSSQSFDFFIPIGFKYYFGR